MFKEKYQFYGIGKYLKTDVNGQPIYLIKQGDIVFGKPIIQEFGANGIAPGLLVSFPDGDIAVPMWNLGPANFPAFARNYYNEHKKQIIVSIIVIVIVVGLIKFYKTKRIS